MFKSFVEPRLGGRISAYFKYQTERLPSDV